MNEPRKYWVGFNLVKGIGPVRLKALLSHFGDAESAWYGDPSALSEAGLGDALIKKLLRVRNEVDLDKIWVSLRKNQIRVITWLDDAYPARLKEIDYPPPLLYLRGEQVDFADWKVAIVGTRRMSSYGQQVTEDLATALVRHGITVVSGMARGVDTMAHRQALRAGGRTLAVLGTGVDRIYPPENRRLARAIMEKGALLSDYPPGTAPEAANFPPRNRIISGLSEAVVVVEAGQRSGAMITASFAAEQGREVFAVPGSIYSPQSKGVNYLLQQGARPLLNVQDILEALELGLQVEKRNLQRAVPADPVENKLLALLEDEPRHVDEIRAQVDMPTEKVTAALALMELKGMVRKVNGMRYVVIRDLRIPYEASRV